LTAGPAARPRRGGRPSRQQSAELRERILDTATRHFLAQGYGATSIDAIARDAGISKRTFYDRFDDKPALFAAVIHRIIDRLRPPQGVPSFGRVGLEEILRRLAGLILRAALAPEAIALHRLIVAETPRFPQLAAALDAEGSTQEAIAFIAGLLEREARAGRLAIKKSRFAAEQFLFMVMTIPQRRAAGLGTPMTAAELDRWGRDVVELFLGGCRGAPRASRESPAPTPARPRRARRA
jgi:AcrR family transcriptional regulator